MSKFVLKFILFLSIIFIILKLMDKYYTNYALKHKNVCEKSDWALNHKNQTFDFAFIGNSRVMNMVDINSIEKRIDKTGINLGLIGANYAESCILLDQFLKNGNKIKNLIIQIDMHSLNSNKELLYPLHYYNYIHLLADSSVSKIFKDNMNSYKFILWKYLPFIRYMEFSQKYRLYKMLKGGFECKTNDKYDSTKGGDIVTNGVLNENEKYNYLYWSINENDEKYLMNLITFAKLKGINPILFTAPIYYKYVNYQLNYSNILKKVIVKTNKLGVRYFDFSKIHDLCANRNDFNDNIHMNIRGVVKLTKILSDSIGPYLK